MTSANTTSCRKQLLRTQERYREIKKEKKKDVVDSEEKEKKHKCRTYITLNCLHKTKD